MGIREVEIGCKVSEAGGMEAFGNKEVDDLIKQGWRVVDIKIKGALMRRVEPVVEGKEWGFIGFSMIVQFEEPK